MILVDTHVISELMRPQPDSTVLSWFDQHDNALLFISVISIAEIAYGLSVLPKGQRRTQLENAFNQAMQIAFGPRVLPFCTDAAYCYGKIMASRKILGQPLGVPDGQIAAIASLHHYALATRNTRDFLHCGIQLINPFEK